MILVFLSDTERTQLNNLVQTTGCTKTYRRAQAILWLADGWKVQDIAARLQVTRFTVSNWRARFFERRSLPANQWFQDKPHSGRPRKGEGKLDDRLNEVIDKDPRDFGYHCTTWTASLLVQYMDEFHHIPVGEETVRRALARLDIHWKRPRHDLAARAPHWRQAKGGSNVA
jgi:transposase